MHVFFCYGTVFYIYDNFVSPDPFELQTSVRGQNSIEFHWESDGHGYRHMTHVCHVSNACFLFGMVQCSIFMTILTLAHVIDITCEAPKH